MPDRISLTQLSLHLPSGLGPSAFGLVPPPPCPLLLDIDLDLAPHVVPASVGEDTMSGLGVNYSSVSKAVYAAISARHFSSAPELLRAAASAAFGPRETPVTAVNVRATLPRALLYADAAVYEQRFTGAREGQPGSGEGYARAQPQGPLTFTARNLATNAVIGLHPHERAERQRLEADVRVCGWTGSGGHKAFADGAFEYLTASSFGTVESLADTFARHVLTLLAPTPSEPSPSVSVTIRKPSALPFATPSICVTRTAGEFAARARAREGGDSGSGAAAGARAGAAVTAGAGAAGAGTGAGGLQPGATKPGGTFDTRRVFIAVGSNIGDRVGHIRRALRLLSDAGVALVATSRLYESEPMYVVDQSRFLNGVIEVSTTLSPLDLLRVLKRTETEVGRVKTYANGPRVLDLDLVLYGSQVVTVGTPGDAPDADGVGWLECPHPRLGEREFVLRPLADIDPDLALPTGERVGDMLEALNDRGLVPVIPFPAPCAPLRLTGVPLIMAIFNATPDSFSDGAPERTDTPRAAALCAALAETGHADMLDIGGMSTRPNSEPCSEADELARVIPLITALRRQDSPCASLPISVDTYRASVAAASVAAGASCINDVRGGNEQGMLAAMAQADLPVVLMHARGDSTSMTRPEAHAYPGGVVADVAAELLQAAARAETAGVKRWDIVLDPGLGFAKNHEQNLQLLKGLPELAERVKPYPLLVGASRKGFVGKAAGVKVASERGAADAAVNAWCANSGVVDVLRVHDARAGRESVAMACAIRDA